MKRRYYGEPDPPAPKPDREFSSTQVDLPLEVARKVKLLSNKIPNSALSEDGREDSPHITVKFGLHDGKPSEKLRKALSGFGAIPATLKSTSLFKNDGFDVVKIDVDSPALHRLNALIAKTVECTDTHPTYRPHATLAYVKSGMGNKYAGDNSLSGTKLQFNSVTFSAKDRSNHTIHLA